MRPSRVRLGQARQFLWLLMTPGTGKLTDLMLTLLNVEITGDADDRARFDTDKRSHLLWIRL